MLRRDTRWSSEQGQRGGRGGAVEQLRGGGGQATDGQQRLTACRSPPAPVDDEPLTVGDVMRSEAVRDDDPQPPPM